MILYHAGFEEIRDPDVHYGRKNADFGQGFYTTDDREFACRWAKGRKGEGAVVNVYELKEEGLDLYRFSRDETWYSYIYRNRHLHPDGIEADVILGPIANDTIYNSLGIIASGFWSEAEVLRLLKIGPEYRQIVIKTQKAAANLHWLSATVLTLEELADFQKTVRKEEEAYQRQLAKELKCMEPP